MKNFAHYDSKGLVRGLITVQGPPQVTASIIPQPGHFVAEIRDLKLDLRKPDLAHIREVVKGIKIKPPAPLIVG